MLEESGEAGRESAGSLDRLGGLLLDSGLGLLGGLLSLGDDGRLLGSRGGGGLGGRGDGGLDGGGGNGLGDGLTGSSLAQSN